MKKIVAFCIIIMCFFSCVNLVNAGEEYEEMFYADPDLQEEIYQITQNKRTFILWPLLEEYGLQVIKESIAVVYELDLLEYAQTGEINLKPLKPEGDYICYVAKCILPDGRFGGNVKMVRHYKTSWWGVTYRSIDAKKEDPWAENPNSALFSCSYADHAERIRKILNRDEIVPATDVRFVMFNYGFEDNLGNNYLGSYFAVKNDGETIFIPVGMEYLNADENIVQSDIVYTAEDIYQKAQEFKNNYDGYVESYQEWKKENLAYRLDFEGGNLRDYIADGTCSQVENIINIYEYLGIDYADNDTTEPTETPVATETELGTLPAETLPTAASTAPSPSPVQTEEADDNSLVIWIAASAAVVIAVIISAVIIKKRKQRKIQ